MVSGRYELSLELRDDPLTRGYVGMSDEACAADLNSFSRKRLEPLSSRQLLEWGAGNQRLKKLSDSQSHTNGDVANLCMAAVQLFSRETTELDLNNSSHLGFIDTLVTAGVLSDQDSLDLAEIASKNISRAQELGLSHVRVGDVERARAS